VPSQSPKPEVHIATSHEPVEQVSVAFGRLQPVPQPPQFVSVVSGVSHPLLVVPSQLPQSDTHAPSVHVPLGQLSAAFARSQVAPHEPQFASVASEASQPFVSLPSQLPKPPLHDATAQVPVVHVAVAFGRLHAAPHAPQFASVRSDVSQPFASFESQSSKLLAQVVISHVPLAHDSPAFGSEHAMPHPPQFVSVFSGVSQPLTSTPSQFAKPALHEPMRQLPVEQSEIAFARLHAMPHPPQLVTVVSDVSQPFESAPSQFA
jgi:hypothetical protein